MKKNIQSSSIFEFYSKPPLSKALPLSLQHILAMIVGTVTVPIIVCGVVDASLEQKMTLIQCALIFSGISTLLQLYSICKIGAKLPVIFGVGFAYVPTLTSIGAKYGISGILGAQLIGGLSMIIVGMFIKKIRKFFPPIVAGTVVLVIGLSLYDIAINYMAGGIGSTNYGSPTNWIIGFITLLVVLIVSQFCKGYLKLASIFCGILAGYLISIFCGIVDFTPIKEASWFAFAKPFEFGMDFNSSAIISMVIICVVNSVQTIGDLSATTMAGLNREITDDELSGGLVGNGVCTLISSIFGAFPTSSFSQNVGIVAMTKVISRSILGLAALFLLLAGFIPKFGAIMTTIPYCVLGGATITVFGMITLTGIKLIIKDELTTRNTTIVSLALALSMGIYLVPSSISQFPDWLISIIGDSPVILAAIIAFTLNIILPNKSLKDEDNERENIDR